MFVIRGPKGWVAKSGHQFSYTTFLQFAQKFKTREEAERNSCPENERVQNIEDVFDKMRR